MRTDALRLCLVTDRDLALGRPLAEVVRLAVRGGVTMVQLREKRAGTRAFLAEAMALKSVLRGTGVPLIINDRVDIALAVEADGVHVGQTDLPVGLVRRLIGPDKWVGLSVSAAAHLDDDDVALADYLGLGPIHLQTTKADASQPLGLEGFERLARSTSKPVVAIGGVKPADIGALIRRGASGVAVVSAIMSAPDPEAAAQAFGAAAAAPST